MLVPIRKASEMTGLHPNTLRKYADNGKLKVIRLKENGQRLFDTTSFEFVRQETTTKNGSPTVCYCRVSSSKQKDDLARQVAYMRERFPDSEIVKDVGSGLNFKRKGLRTILQRLLQGDKFTLIVAHRDRLCRFGFELIEFLFEQNGGELMVLNREDVSPQQELTEDLLTILHVFSCRMHGLRKYSDKIKEDKDLSKSETEDIV